MNGPEGGRLRRPAGAGCAMMGEMADDPEILGSLPRTRPHRRSARRAGGVVPESACADADRPTPRRPRPVRTAAPETKVAGAAARSRPAEAPAHRAGPDPAQILGTALRAAGEIAEIGLTVGTQALRGALERLPRP